MSGNEDIEADVTPDGGKSPVLPGGLEARILSSGEDGGVGDASLKLLAKEAANRRAENGPTIVQVLEELTGKKGVLQGQDGKFYLGISTKGKDGFKPNAAAETLIALGLSTELQPLNIDDLQRNVVDPRGQDFINKIAAAYVDKMNTYAVDGDEHRLTAQSVIAALTSDLEKSKSVQAR